MTWHDESMDHDVPIVIRARRSDDTPAVVATMRSDLAHLNRHSDWTEIVEAQAGPLSGAPALVALAADRVVGGGGLEEVQPGRFTLSYWVVSGMTGQGIASALVRHLFDEGLRASATDLYAGVVHGNSASVCALMKNGFTCVATFDT